MRAKFIYEKFSEESDPISDLNVGHPFKNIKKFDIIKINQKSGLTEKTIHDFMISFFTFHKKYSLGAKYDLDLVALVYYIKRYKNKLNLKLIFTNSKNSAKMLRHHISKGITKPLFYSTVEATQTYDQWVKYFEIINEQ